MKKQQHILTLIIVLAVIGIAVVIASIIYDEKIRDNKKAVETISVPENEEKVEESLPIDEEDNTIDTEESQDNYVGEEEKESQEQVEEEQKESKQTDDEKAIELAKKEWGNDDSVSFSIEEKKDNKIYVAVKNDATVIQWYEVNTNDWTISEY